MLGVGGATRPPSGTTWALTETRGGCNLPPLAKYKYSCLFQAQCGSAAAGSREHAFQAALGGLRTDTRILCDVCQAFFSHGLDGVLPPALRHFNTLRSVVSRHAGVVRPAPLSDEVTGHQFLLDEGQAIRSAEPVMTELIVDAQGLQEREYKAIGSPKDLAAFNEVAFLERLHATEGKKFKIVGRLPSHEVLIARPLHADTSFGGDETFRAVARIALNYLAAEEPSLARSAGLEPMKRWVRTGNPEGDFVNFADPLADGLLLPNPFEFGHRVALGFCASTQTITARISLFGVHELAVKLGSANCPRSYIAVIDIDPSATRIEDGVDTRRFGAIAELAPMALGTFASDPQAVVERNQRTTASLLDGANARAMTARLESVVGAVNAAKPLLRFQQAAAIQQALSGQLQLAFNILAFVAKKTASMLRAEGHKAPAQFFDFVVAAEDGDVVARTHGVLAAEQVLSAIASSLLEELAKGQVAIELLRDLLEGPRGCRIAYSVLLELCAELGLIPRDG